MVNLITFGAVYMTFSKSKILDGKADNFMCLGKKTWFKKCLGIFLLRPGIHCWPEFFKLGLCVVVANRCCLRFCAPLASR